MKIYIVRHGRTAFNEERRYQGRTDTELLAEEAERLRKAGFTPGSVYISPAKRARQTADIIFPDAVKIPVEGFQEMDFGAFEGRTALEMSDDPEYRAWVDSGCTSRTPGGEDMAGFAGRNIAAFTRILEENFARGSEELVIVAHGGTQMTILGNLARQDILYWKAMTNPGCGAVCEADPRVWEKERKIDFIGETDFSGGKNE